jgi:hypothetical protein
MGEAYPTLKVFLGGIVFELVRSIQRRFLRAS